MAEPRADRLARIRALAKAAHGLEVHFDVDDLRWLLEQVPVERVYRVEMLVDDKWEPVTGAGPYRDPRRAQQRLAAERRSKHLGQRHKFRVTSALVQAWTPMGEEQDPADPPTFLHACPPRDTGLTPCCGRTPFELPANDRITIDRLAVTCKGPF